MSPLGSMTKPEPVARCGSSGSSREASPDARRTRTCTSAVGELRNEELLERQAAGIRRSRERDDDPLRTDAELRARQHRRGADLRVGEHAEELAEAGQTLVEQRLDRLERGVARRDPG